MWLNKLVRFTYKIKQKNTEREKKTNQGKGFLRLGVIPATVDAKNDLLF